MELATPKIVKALALYSITVFGVLFVTNTLGAEGDRVTLAIMTMAGGLVLVWCVLGGSLMYHYRDRFRVFFRKLPGSWPVKFVVFGTLFAFLEEVVTVSLTNTAPLWGVSMEDAHITASANYFDTVFGHSALLFVGWFIAWAWLLKRYAFTTIEVFLLFGLLGSIAEVSMGGWGMLIAGFWYFVYGLMIFLPAYAIPQERNVPRPKWRHYLLAIVLPLLVTIPFGLLMQGYIYFFDPQFFTNI